MQLSRIFFAENTNKPHHTYTCMHTTHHVHNMHCVLTSHTMYTPPTMHTHDAHTSPTVLKSTGVAVAVSYVPNINFAVCGSTPVSSLGTMV